MSLALATFLSEDLACISAGVLVAEGHMSFLFATFACFIGIFIGDMLLFIAGRYIGRPALGRAPLRWLVRPGSLERASEWLVSNGALAIATSRFVPGTRLPTYIAAGVLRTSTRKFLVYFLIAAAAWTPLIVGLSAGLGMPLMHSGFLSHRPLSVRLLLVAAGIFLLVRLSHKTRHVSRASCRSTKMEARYSMGVLATFLVLSAGGGIRPLSRDQVPKLDVVYGSQSGDSSRWICGRVEA